MAFELMKNLAGAIENFGGDAGKAGDMDSVTLIRAAGVDFVHEDDVVGRERCFEKLPEQRRVARKVRNGDRRMITRAFAADDGDLMPGGCKETRVRCHDPFDSTHHRRVGIMKERNPHRAALAQRVLCSQG